MGVLEKRKISCLLRDSNAGPSNQYPSDFTDRKQIKCVRSAGIHSCPGWDLNPPPHWPSSERYYTPYEHDRTSKSAGVNVTVGFLRINNQQDAPSTQNFILSRNATCFGHLLCPSSGVISCTRGNWHVSCRLCGLCLGESSSNLTLLGKAAAT